MPNIKSAKKRVDVAERNRDRNVAIKSKIKTAIRRVLESIQEGSSEKIKTTLSLAYSLLDKAVSKGVLHKNTVARKKSRLTKAANKEQA